MNKVFTTIILWLLAFNIYSQTYNISGKVTDVEGQPLIGVTIVLNYGSKGAVSDINGNYSIEVVTKGSHTLQALYLGYHDYVKKIDLEKDLKLDIVLQPGAEMLKEVVIREDYKKQKTREDSRNIDFVDKEYLKINLSGSLMQTLSRLPGVQSMDIGSGQSKPAIRGLGFNRVVVVQDGIKHQGQEWGADHGLEIDQFSTENIEIIKGPAAIMYGSDAIGGVIDIKSNIIPAENIIGGSLDMIGKTNNNLIGSSAFVYGREKSFFYNARLTYMDYGDYKVPADSIEYLTYYFRLKDHYLRNTAGKEKNGSITLGLIKDWGSSRLIISNANTESGFFANAHGLEIRTSQIDYDKSNRDIDLPYQSVNHFKIINNTDIIKGNQKLSLNLGFQQNLRREFSEATEHGYMPKPKNSKEREFDKKVYSANIKWHPSIIHRQNLNIGINSSYQDNKIDGWGFLIPDFNSFSVGAYVYDRFKVNEVLTLNSGIRYDFGNIQTAAQYDWYETPVFDDNGLFMDSMHLQRSQNLNRSFNQFSWMFGLVYLYDKWVFKANVGKSFRMPIAKELASNGVNYHIFRYEVGNTDLDAETSYQLDLSAGFENEKLNFEFSPFVNYFPNYIFLNPSVKYYEALQVYEYRQSEVFRTGSELVVDYSLNNYLSFRNVSEYVFSRQLSGDKKGFGLPFAPPFSNIFSVQFKPNIKSNILHYIYFTLDNQFVLAQKDIVPPEKETPGYYLVNFKIGTHLSLWEKDVHAHMQIINILNNRYLDHTSFYRLIEVPGPGRNYILTLEIPFKKHLKN
jgi:iron complex outermembrane receptor protein